MNGDLQKLIRTLVAPMVEFENKLNIEIKEDNNVIQCSIHAAGTDVGRLIGRNGSVAENIQQVVRAFGHLGLKKVQISVIANNG
ncbi:KH domain-containing protein [Xylocopilactobacillus apicola]|uniref:UPF0109 protein n=1 Tax=Xylocopilactobacillus apicola TaxID=2932184 RepID=A0AAU9DW53_9LACO|nr:KH domain-containing protein [Xylocopilactobacillus apicola]BDR58188.1 UPF0109 protein [Xylocopilactobacillus apicola]